MNNRQGIAGEISYITIATQLDECELGKHFNEMILQYANVDNSELKRSLEDALTILNLLKAKLIRLKVGRHDI
ncbi:MAG: hypothetical protein JHC33_10130 [Ignisphaera sp.]|nr:hypothetical protein [Ignisphaera sp.]